MEEIEFKLNKIVHYSKIPEMKPFIGTNYYSSEKKVLIIGESHFFDHEPLNKNPECNPGAKIWYSYNVVIPKEKLAYINTRESVKKGTHRIFSNLKTVLAEALNENQKVVLKSIAYMNAFQRPANHKGVGMDKLAVEQDFQVAEATITQVISILKPNYVIFVSKLSWDKIGVRLQKKENINYGFTNHPNSYCWNNGENSKKKILTLLK